MSTPEKITVSAAMALSIIASVLAYQDNHEDIQLVNFLVYAANVVAWIVLVALLYRDISLRSFKNESDKTKWLCVIILLPPVIYLYLCLAIIRSRDKCIGFDRVESVVNSCT